jgi:hypothetical protein
MKISPLKSKVMAFKGQVPIRSKLAVDNIVLEQVNKFIYLGCKISCVEEKGITSKIKMFLQILGILNNVLKPYIVQRQSLLKVLTF